MTMAFKLQAKNKPALLSAMMRGLAGPDSKIAFEGHLGQTDLGKLPGVVSEESQILRRGTLQPRLDFLVLPLTSESLPKIEKAIYAKVSFSGSRGIIHVQIEKGGELVFAALDSFHPETVLAGSAVPSELLDKLVRDGVLRGYQQSSDEAPVL